MVLCIFSSSSTKHTLIKIVIFILVGLLSLQCHAGRGRKKSATPYAAASWKPWNDWLEQEPRCRDLVKEIKEQGLEIHEIAFPVYDLPKGFTSPKLHQLLNDLINHVEEWLETYNFLSAPSINGHEHGQLPQEPSQTLLNYINQRDPILIPALIHLIYIARHGEYCLQGEAAKILKYRLIWLEKVTLPEGINIDWDKAYKKLFKQRKNWKNKIELPEKVIFYLDIDSDADTGEEESWYDFVKMHLNDKWYRKKLHMITTWNDRRAFFDAGMNFMKVDPSDPLLLPHLEFSLGAALAGGYLQEDQSELIAHWLKADEDKKELDSCDRETWKVSALSYMLPTPTKKNKKALTKKTEGHAEDTKSSKADSKTVKQSISLQKGTSLQKSTDRSKVEQKIKYTEGDWQKYDDWWQKEERCQKLVKSIKRKKLNIREIAFPSYDLPEGFTSEKLNTLLNDFINYVEKWLAIYGFKPAPILNGYQNGKLPDNPDRVLFNYIRGRDPILIPALTHLIYIAFQGEKSLTEAGKEILRYRLAWLENVTLPEGMTIDWSNEYKKLLQENRRWKTIIELPEESDTSDSSEDEYKPSKKVVDQYLYLQKYNKELNMMTTWNDRMELYNTEMKFGLLGKSDPLLRSHLKFSLRAALTGGYLKESQRKLITYWLSSDEYDCELSKQDSKKWKRGVLSYRLPVPEEKKVSSETAVGQSANSEKARYTPSRTLKKPKDKVAFQQYRSIARRQPPPPTNTSSKGKPRSLFGPPPSNLKWPQHTNKPGNKPLIPGGVPHIPKAVTNTSGLIRTAPGSYSKPVAFVPPRPKVTSTSNLTSTSESTAYKQKRDRLIELAKAGKAKKFNVATVEKNMETSPTVEDATSPVFEHVQQNGLSIVPDDGLGWKVHFYYPAPVHQLPEGVKPK